MKTLVKLAVVGIFMLGWAGGCWAKERLVIDGTGDSEQLLQALGTAFSEEHGVEVEIPPSVGSTGGIQRLLKGYSDLARVARQLKDDEKGDDLNLGILAYSPITLAANLEEPCVDSLTSQQLIAIYSGEITSWSELGACPDRKIFVINREPGDSSRTTLERAFPALKEISPLAGITTHTTTETVETLEHYPYTLAYIPRASAAGSTVQFLKLDGVAPTTANVQENKYGLFVPLGIVWKGKLEGAAKRFVDFLFGPRAYQIILDQGGIPAFPQPAATTP